MIKHTIHTAFLKRRLIAIIAILASISLALAQQSAPTVQTPPRFKEGLTPDEQKIRDEYWNARFVEHRPLVGWINRAENGDIGSSPKIENIIIDEADRAASKNKKSNWLVVANQFFNREQTPGNGHELKTPENPVGTFSKSINISRIPSFCEDLVKVYIYMKVSQQPKLSDTDADDIVRQLNCGATVIICDYHNRVNIKCPKEHPLSAMISGPKLKHLVILTYPEPFQNTKPVCAAAIENKPLTVYALNQQITAFVKLVNDTYKTP